MKQHLKAHTMLFLKWQKRFCIGFINQKVHIGWKAYLTKKIAVPKQLNITFQIHF